MKKNSTTVTARFSIIAVTSLLMLNACHDDGHEVLPSEIQFSLDLQSVREGDETYVRLTFDKPAAQSGSVELAMETNAIYNQHFETDPLSKTGTLVLNISKGQKSAEVKIRAIDNARYEGGRFIIFHLKNPTEGFRLGANTTLTFTIADDEGPSLGNFAVKSATLDEKEEMGIVVHIPFSDPAKGEGSVTVMLNAGHAVNGTNFIIDQELDLDKNSFVLNVLPNATSVSFRVFPLDDNLFTGNFILQFAITDVSGVVHKGNNLSYSLTLVDDEAPSVARFALLSGTIEESNTDGIMVEVLLSSPVKGEGTIGIALDPENLIYGTDFTTVPATQNNRLVLNLSHDQTSASFTVFPVDNDVPTEDEILSLSIHETTGVAWKGSDSLTYKLTIIDDE